jgi:hypothetical protein
VPVNSDYRKVTTDQQTRPVQPSATTAVHFVCTSRLRHRFEDRLGIWFPDNQVHRPSACRCIYLYLFCVHVCVSNCSYLLEICGEMSIQSAVTHI